MRKAYETESIAADAQRDLGNIPIQILMYRYR